MKEFSELNALNPEKRQYLLYFWSDKWFKGFVVNRTLPSLHIESIEITLTVPLRNFKIILRLTLDVVVMDLKIKTLHCEPNSEGKVLRMYLLLKIISEIKKLAPSYYLLFPIYLQPIVVVLDISIYEISKVYKYRSWENPQDFTLLQSFLHPRHFANMTWTLIL